MAGEISLPNSTDTLGTTPASGLLIFLQVAVLLWILLANFALWVVLRITRAFHRPLTYLLANLILANYLLGASSLPFSIINLGLLWRWPFGVGLCELWHGFDVIARTAFAWFVFAIVVERWLYCYKQRWLLEVKMRRTLLVLVAIWIVTVFVSGIGFLAMGRPNFFSYTDPQLEFFQCYWSTQNSAYAIYHSVTAYFLPLLLAFLLYITLLLRTWRARKLYKPPASTTTEVRPMTSGTVVSEWSEVSLPATPNTGKPGGGKRINTPSALGSGRAGGGGVEVLQLSPVRRPGKVAPLYSDEDEKRPPSSAAWGGGDETESRGGNSSSRLSWANIIFSKMLIQRAMKTPAAKPTVNEDLIKTLPKNRVPRRLPKLEQEPGNLPRLDTFMMDRLEQAGGGRHFIDGDEIFLRDPIGGTPRGGRDSGFGSNQGTPNTGRRSKWNRVNGIGGLQEMPSPDVTNEHDKWEEEEEEIYDEEKDNPIEHFKAIKWIWIIILLAFITWLPFYAIYLALNLCTGTCSADYLLYSAMQWVSCLNAALNPLVLVLAVADYRLALGWLLRCRDPNALYGGGLEEGQGEEGGTDTTSTPGDVQPEEDEDEVIKHIKENSRSKVQEVEVKKRDSGGKYTLDRGDSFSRANIVGEVDV